MKKALLTLFIIVASLAAQAYDYPYLIFQTTDGTVHAIAVESLTIDVSGSNLVATNSEGSQTFALAELSKMFFSESVTGVGEMFSPDGGEVDVFAVTGAHLGRYANAKEATTHLKTGMYLLKSKSATIKIVVR